MKDILEKNEVNLNTDWIFDDIELLLMFLSIIMLSGLCRRLSLLEDAF